MQLLPFSTTHQHLSKNPTKFLGGFFQGLSRPTAVSTIACLPLFFTWFHLFYLSLFPLQASALIPYAALSDAQQTDSS